MVARDTSPEARIAQLRVYRRLDGPARLALACEMSDEARSAAEAGRRHRLEADGHEASPVRSADLAPGGR